MKLLASQQNLAAILLTRFLNFEFDAIFGEIALQWCQIQNSKIQSIEKLPNLVEKLISEFQVKIFKSVGGVATLVI